MKYLKEQYLLDRKGNILQVNIKNDDNSVTIVTATFFWAVKYVASSYLPSEQMTLTIGDIRSLNKAIDILEANQDSIDTEVQFENEYFEVLYRVVTTLLPLIYINIIIMNAPQIYDMLNV